MLQDHKITLRVSHVRAAQSPLSAGLPAKTGCSNLRLHCNLQYFRRFATLTLRMGRYSQIFLPPFIIGWGIWAVFCPRINLRALCAAAAEPSSTPRAATAPAGRPCFHVRRLMRPPVNQSSFFRRSQPDLLIDHFHQPFRSQL